MKKYPNSSTLSFFTCVKDNDHEEIIFFYLKPVGDYFSSTTPYWYPEKTIWPQLKIKHRSVFGQDNVVNQILDEILSQNAVRVGENEINFSFPLRTSSLEQNDFGDREDAKCELFKAASYPSVPKEFYLKENLDIICGYLESNDMIFPYSQIGFFDRDFIHDYIWDNVYGVKEHRTPYLTFHGVQKTSIKGKGSTEFVGFYQSHIDNATPYKAIIKSESSTILGESSITPENGTFKISLSEPSAKGWLEILADNAPIKSIKYTLVQDINISTNIISRTYSDIYSRTIPISDEPRTDTISPLIWHRGEFANTDVADMQLSDYFRSLFNYLGPNVVIVDPYFINEISIDIVTNSYNLRHCQKAFFNSLFHSFVEKKIEKVYILGYWARASDKIKTNVPNGSTKALTLFNIYERVIKGNIIGNKLQHYIPNGSIEFYNADVDIHNRYWFSFTKENEVITLNKVVTCSNSIGNMNEVDFLPVLDVNASQKLCRRYGELVNKGELKVTI